MPKARAFIPAASRHAHRTAARCLVHCFPDRFLFLVGRVPQFHPAEQLCIRGHDDGGETHCDCPNAHGQIESPSDEKASCDRDGKKVIGVAQTRF